MNEMIPQQGLGLKKESAATLAVLLGPTIVIPFAIFLLEKDRYVRFYALQSIVVFLGLIIIGQVVSFLPFVFPFSGLVWIVGFVVWLVLVYSAWNNREFSLPIVGQITNRFLS